MKFEDVASDEQILSVCFGKMITAKIENLDLAASEGVVPLLNNPWRAERAFGIRSRVKESIFVYSLLKS